MPLKIYLDTSVISALFDDKNPERKMLTREFFMSSKKYDIYISDISLAEIEKTDDENLKKMMKEFVKSFFKLEINDEVRSFAYELIKTEAVLKNSPEDAYHIAIAVDWHMDYLLSWNFRHIVRMKTRDVVRLVSTLNGYGHIEISAPAELN